MRRLTCVECGQEMQRRTLAAECPTCGQWPLCHLCLIDHVEEGLHYEVKPEDER